MMPCLDSDYLFRFILQIAMCLKLRDSNKENPSTELGKTSLSCKKAVKEEKDNHDLPCRFITVKLSFTCHPFYAFPFSFEFVIIAILIFPRAAAFDTFLRAAKSLTGMDSRVMVSLFDAADVCEIRALFFML